MSSLKRKPKAFWTKYSGRALGYPSPDSTTSKHAYLIYDEFAVAATLRQLQTKEVKWKLFLCNPFETKL